MIRAYLNLRQVAELLGYSEDYVYRHVRRWQAEAANPFPRPAMGRKYDPLAVEIWQNNRLAPAQRRQLAPIAVANDDAPAAGGRKALLRARAQAIAEREAGR